MVNENGEIFLFKNCWQLVYDNQSDIFVWKRSFSIESGIILIMTTLIEWSKYDMMSQFEQGACIIDLHSLKNAVYSWIIHSIEWFQAEEC